MLGAIGDSHCRGYVPDIGGQGYRGVFGELGAMIGTKKLTVINLGRSGHTRAQIAKRVRAWENQLDMGGWIVQRASINDKDASFDYQVTTADSSWNYLQDDWVFDGDKTKIFIPWEGFGMTGAASGWYDRFNTHKAEEQALWPYSIYTSSSILNADGSYKAGVGGSDNGHPNILGYQTAAVPVWAGLQSALTTLGITI
jgi:lysophospholipase L1-like esterase